MTPTFAESAPQLMLRAADDSNWRDGNAEPWVAAIVAALARGNATRVAVEVGGFRGYTSATLHKALSTLPWRTTLTVCEIDAARAADVRAAIAGPANAVVNNASVVVANSLDWIPTLSDGSVDFVWLDGNHEAQHVYHEIELMLPKLAPGGILAGHDVYGICDLRYVFAHFGGYSLDLPRLGPAGGIGLLQQLR